MYKVILRAAIVLLFCYPVLAAESGGAWQQTVKRAQECYDKSDYKNAEKHFREALELLKGTENTDRANCLVRLAISLMETPGTGAERTKEAERLVTEGLALRRKLLGNEHEDVASALYSLARAYREQGRNKEALDEALECVRIARKALKPTDSDLELYLCRLGSIHYRLKNWDGSLEAYSAAAEVARKNNNVGHLCSDLESMSDALQQQGKIAEAEQALKDALSASEKSAGHEATTADVLCTMAAFYKKQKKPAEAVAALEKSVELTTKSPGANNEKLADRLRDLAEAYGAAKQFDKGINAYRRAVEIVRSGSDELKLALFHNNFGYYCSEAKDFPEAIAQLKKSLALRLKLQGLNHKSTRETQFNLAWTYIDASQWDDAAPLLEELVRLPDLERDKKIRYLKELSYIYSWKRLPKIQEKYLSEALKVCDEDPPAMEKERRNCMNLLASAYMNQGRLREAEEIWRRSLVEATREHGKESTQTAGISSDLGSVLCEQARFAESEKFLLDALAIYKRLSGQDSEEVGGAYNSLSYLYGKWNREYEAVNYSQEAYRIARKNLGPEHPTTLKMMKNLAVRYMDIGRYAESKALDEEALRIRERVLGPNHPSVATSLILVANHMDEDKELDTIESMQDRAVRIRQAAFGKEHSLTLEAMLGRINSTNMRLMRLRSEAEALERAGNRAAAKLIFQKAQEKSDLIREQVKECYQISLKIQGAMNPQTARIAQRLALYAVIDGRYGEAEAFYLSKLASDLETLGSAEIALQNNLLPLKEMFWLRMCDARARARQTAWGSRRPDSITEALELTLTGDRLSSRSEFGGADDAYKKAIALIEKASAKDSGLYRRELADCIEARALNRMKAHSREPVIPELEKVMALRGKESQVENALTDLDICMRFSQLGTSRFLDATSMESNKNRLFYAHSNILALAGEKEGATGLIHACKYDAAMFLSYLLADNFQGRLAGGMMTLALNSIDCNNASDLVQAERRLEIAEIYIQAELYVRARQAIDAATKIARDNKDNLLLARCLSAGARLSLMQGDFAEALRQGELVLEIENLPPSKIADALQVTSESAANIGLTGGDSRYIESALQSAQRLLKLQAEEKSSLARAKTLVILARLYQEKALSSEATACLSEAIKIGEAHQSSEGQLILGEAYSTLAAVRFAAGDFEGAGQLVAKAYQIHKRDKTNKVNEVEDLNMLAFVANAKGDRSGAQSMMFQAASRLDARIFTVFPRLSFAEQRAFLDTVLDTATNLLTLCHDPQSMEKTYSYLMRWKGLLVEGLRGKSATVASGSGKADAMTLSILRLTIAQASDMEGEGARKLVETFTRQKEQHERNLPIQVTDPITDVKTVAHFLKSLAADEVLVDIYTYRALPDLKKRYGAVVVEKSGVPRLIDLGDVESINKTIRDWRRNGLYAGGTRDTLLEEPQQALVRKGNEGESWNALRTRVWLPLKQAMPPAVKKILICDDGELSRMPWNKFIVENANANGLLLCHIDSPRELLLLRAPKPPGKEPAKVLPVLVVGGIRYFDPKLTLKGAKEEIREIEKLAIKNGVPARVLTESQPTKKEILISARNSRIVHLATHGFFKGGERTSSDSTRGLRVSSNGGAFSAGRNPLLRSGILLAQPEGEKARGEAKLTAEEIVGTLDLKNCELVTLSACDTGRGEEVTGQGVIGLRSAIMAAGARSVLLSLWPVDDEATRVLMCNFYANLWEKKMTTAMALQQAQIAVRNNKQHPNWKQPLYWAAWELVGQGWN